MLPPPLSSEASVRACRLDRVAGKIVRLPRDPLEHMDVQSRVLELTDRATCL